MTGGVPTRCELCRKQARCPRDCACTCHIKRKHKVPRRFASPRVLR